MSDPVVYKSTDPSAPTLTRTAGSWVNVLRKVLVDGYGSKPAAGWSMSTISTNQQNAIFKPNVVGGWFYLVYDDHRNNYVTDKMALLAAVDSYTDVENYASALTYSSWVSRIPENAGSNQGLVKPQSGNWCIIADDKTAIIITDLLNTTDINYRAIVHVIGSVSNLGSVPRQILLGANPNHITADACQLGHLATDGFCKVGTRIPVSEALAGGVGYLSGFSVLKAAEMPKGPGIFSDGLFARLPISTVAGAPECLIPGLFTCLYRPNAIPPLFSESSTDEDFLFCHPFAIKKSGWTI